MVGRVFTAGTNQALADTLLAQSAFSVLIPRDYEWTRAEGHVPVSQDRARLRRGHPPHHGDLALPDPSRHAGSRAAGLAPAGGSRALRHPAAGLAGERQGDPDHPPRQPGVPTGGHVGEHQAGRSAPRAVHPARCRLSVPGSDIPAGRVAVDPGPGAECAPGGARVDHELVPVRLGSLQVSPSNRECRAR